MPKIESPQRRVLPTTAITDTRRLLPMGIFEEQFAARRGVAGAIGQMGRIAGAAAINTIRAQGEEEFTSAKLDYETAFRTFQAELLTDTDYAGYPKKFNGWHDDFTAQRVKQINHRGAQTRTQQQFDLNRAIRGKTIDTNAQHTLVRETRRLLPDKIEAFVSEELQADTPETLKKADTERKAYFQTLIETGVLNAEEAVVLEQQYQTAKGERILQNTVTGLAVEEGWDAALAWLNEPKNVKELVDDFGLELADIDRILEDVRTQATLSKAGGIAELENQRKTDRQAILNKMLANDFADMPDFVNDTALAPEEKLRWLEKSETRAEAINTGKDDPMNQTDPAIYFELRRKIETDPGSVTEEDLANAVGEGISISDYEKFLGRITDKDNPLNSSSSQRAQASFGRLREAEKKLEVGDPADEEDIAKIRVIEDKWLKIGDENDAYLLSEEGRKATDEQRQKKRQALTEPVREAITLNWFEKLMLTERFPLFGPIPTEPERLVNKKINALEKEEFWKTLTDEDKEAIRTRLEQGDTVANIIKLAAG